MLLECLGHQALRDAPVALEHPDWWEMMELPELPERMDQPVCRGKQDPGDPWDPGDRLED